jgi:hypothetical protein
MSPKIPPFNQEWMDEFKVFKTFKERGEWVEALFMAASLRHGYKVLKPWGDSAPFDLALYFGNRIVRVQVKSTSCRVGTGYFCQFKPNYFSDPYTLAQLDFFAAYVIMQNAWYLIPAKILLGGKALKQGLMLCPMQPLKKNRYSYEHYREAWPLLCPRRKK